MTMPSPWPTSTKLIVTLAPLVLVAAGVTLGFDALLGLWLGFAALALLLGVFWTCPVRAQSDGSAEGYVVQVWDTDTGLPHSSVTTIAQTPDGYLWIGTLISGVARFAGVVDDGSYWSACQVAM